MVRDENLCPNKHMNILEIPNIFLIFLTGIKTSGYGIYIEIIVN